MLEKHARRLRIANMCCNFTQTAPSAMVFRLGGDDDLKKLTGLFEITSLRGHFSQTLFMHATHLRNPSVSVPG